MGSRIRKPSRPIVIPMVVSGVLALAWCGVVKADDVSLIPGTVFKQAIGGKVKGQVQSESPSEVVVLLGATTTNVPVDQIASIRYDGQSATYTLAESREANGQLAEAADLFKKAAAESAGKPFPLQAALFREAEVLTDLAPDRAGSGQGGEGPAYAIRASLSERSPYRRRSRLPGAAPVECG